MKQRMKHLIKVLSVLSIMGIVVPTHADVTEDCEKEWPGDYRMQEYCLKKASKGAGRVYAYLERHNLTLDNWVKHQVMGEVPAIIFGRCQTEWGKNIPMLAYCLEKEEKAAMRLGKIGGDPEDSIEFEPGINGDIAAMGIASQYLRKYELGKVSEAEKAAEQGNKAGIMGTSKNTSLSGIIGVITYFWSHENATKLL